MRVVLRYVNDEGCVIERFLGIVHVADTCSYSLKSAIDDFFTKHGLSLSKLRGQVYDGASNMRGELSELYPDDFSPDDCLYLPHQLNNFVANVRLDPHFSTISNLGSLARAMVTTSKHLVFPTVYHMIELALVLPVATASVEKAFSAMKTVKNDLRNRMSDEWLNDCLVVYIEKDIFSTIDNESILQYFQTMTTHKYQLSPLS